MKPIVIALALLSLALPLSAERPEASAPAAPELTRAAWERHEELVSGTPFHGLAWTSLGPVVQGGRIVDIERIPGEPYHFYVAYASGGVWKTTNNGFELEPIFDTQPTMIIGDLAVDPNRPERLWVGTGENNSSRSSYGGMGMFRSDDGGATFTAAGLAGADRIGRIIVHPHDSDTVWVAVLGKLYTAGGERGVFRTRDGGATWERVLAGEDWTGVVDLALDPADPDTLYAATWDRRRRPWDFVEGGEGSGIHKSTDGGSTWARVEGGFPRGDHVGRIGLALSPSQPGTLYAALDNQELLPEEQWDLGDGAVTPKRLRSMTKEDFLRQDPEEVEDFLRSTGLDPTLTGKKLLEKIESGEITLEQLLAALEDANRNLFETDIKSIEVWRSDDGGGSWTRTHDEPIRDMVYTYGYYFGQIRADPKDIDHLYILGVPMLESKDGGKSWTNTHDFTVHVDHHALWLDPDTPERMVLGNDGGLYLTFDGGESWLPMNKVAVGQFYTIMVDSADPYNVYGGLQDNGVYKGSHECRAEDDGCWRRIGGGDGMYVAVDTRDNKTTYWGFQFGNYFRIGPDGRERIRPFHTLDEEPLRFNWNTPVILSSHNQDIVYFGANKLFRSMDQGETFEAISGDLTVSEERGDVPFATISTISESPLRFGLLWVGTDDGQVWKSDDGGVEWHDLGATLPRERWVSRIEASHHDAEVAHLSLNGYRDDDSTSYLYRTADGGGTWSDISAGLPAEPVNVVREDPVNPKVLYVGTDKGVYVSLDQGASWHGLGSGLPTTPVHDLIVHPRERELLVGTHGRSVWLLDVLPVQEWEEIHEQELHLFPLEPVEYQRYWSSRRSRWFYDPEDDPELVVPFWSAVDGAVEVTIRDQDDRVLFSESVAATAGVSSWTWNLLLDEELALAAERASLAGDDEEKKKRKKKKKKKTKKQEKPEPPRETLADTPWAETVRLERPLYLTPGSYSLQVERGGETASTELEVEVPEPRQPRVAPEPLIRGRKGDKDD